MQHSDRQIPLASLAAWSAWGFVLACLLGGTIVALTTSNRLPIALALYAHGLAGSAAAATLSIRNIVTKRDRLLRDAFEYGREVAPGVRRVR